jgi:DNA polymerase III subunit delta
MQTASDSTCLQNALSIQKRAIHRRAILNLAQATANPFAAEVMAQKKSHEVDAFVARPDAAFRVVLVYGPDKGLVSERASAFARAAGFAADDPFAVVRLDGAEVEADPGRLVDEARTVPLFGGERLVWVREAGAGKGLGEAVKHLASEPPRDARVLIEAGDLKKGAGLRATVEAAPQAMALPCYADDARSIDALIDATLAGEGLGITLEARQVLKESLGGDRLATRAELEKLCLYARGQDRIGLEDVREAVGDVAGLSTDDVVDMVLVGRLKEFERTFDRYMRSGAPGFLVLSAMSRQLLALQPMREAIEREGKAPAAVVASARPPVFFSRRRTVEDAVARWSLAAIGRALERLQAAVLESRRVPQLSAAIIRQALMGLAVEAARARPGRG